MNGFGMNTDHGLITQPLLLSGPRNERSLALFTSEARARSVRESRPEYQYACEVPFSAALKSLSPNVGISFNSGWKTSLHIPAEALAPFKLSNPAGI
ncbi:MAG: hypothetical protein JWR26_1086 [Pedosphaera sp.]|nr:hypothetical protein [Pedosphaera sp.]